MSGYILYAIPQFENDLSIVNAVVIIESTRDMYLWVVARLLCPGRSNALCYLARIRIPSRKGVMDGLIVGIYPVIARTTVGLVSKSVINVMNYKRQQQFTSPGINPKLKKISE